MLISVAVPQSAGMMPPSSEAIDPRELGRLLRKFIAATGKTQAKVADELGVDPTYVSQMVNGKVNWTTGMYFGRLVRILGLRTEQVRELKPDAFVEASSEKLNSTHENVSEYVLVRIEMVRAGITDSMNSHNSTEVWVSKELAARTLGGLHMPTSYVQGIPAGFYALWSDRVAEAGELVVIEHRGAQYPAFLLLGGLVEVDTAINQDTPLRFRPDRIVGVVEEVRMMGVPSRRDLS